MFRRSVIDQVLRYKQSLGESLTKEQIELEPWENTVQSWWESKAYFKEPGFYTKLENIPEDYAKDTVRIVNRKGLHTYKRVNGEWIYTQSVTKELYKD